MNLFSSSRASLAVQMLASSLHEVQARVFEKRDGDAGIFSVVATISKSIPRRSGFPHHNGKKNEHTEIFKVTQPVQNYFYSSGMFGRRNGLKLDPGILVDFYTYAVNQPWKLEKNLGKISGMLIKYHSSHQQLVKALCQKYNTEAYFIQLVENHNRGAWCPGTAMRQGSSGHISWY